jgi:hypothetical protein
MRRCLAGYPGETHVEIEQGVPMTAKTLVDLRALPTWPPGDWVMHVFINGDQRVVRVEWPSYARRGPSHRREHRHAAGAALAAAPLLRRRTAPLASIMNVLTS